MPPWLKLAFGTLAVAVLGLAGVAMLQAREVDRKARGIHAAMSLREVMQRLDGWRMINTHPLQRRAIPHGTGPEFNGYAGDTFTLSRVQPDSRETDRQTLTQAEFVAQLERLLSSGEPWVVYFSYRTVPTHRGILVRFDGQARVAGER